MSALSSQLKVAFVYDRVNTPYGGAENVLVALHHIFPDAPLFTSVYDPNRAQWAKGFRVIPSFLQRLPFAKHHHRWFAWAMPLAFESFDLSEFDIVISITSAEAKGILTKPHQLHICYLLTPTRYLWSHAEEYEKSWLTGWLRKIVFKYLKWWDEAACWRPDVLIPISELVAERSLTFYQRQTEAVIYPPVEKPSLTKQELQQIKKPLGVPEEYYLIVSRLVPYKRIDMAIKACQTLKKNLVIIGEGPDYVRLVMLAGMRGNATAKILFLQAVHPKDVIAYYTHCTAFLMPAEEDFGITALEAQSFGKPVFIYHKSGAAEIVKDGVTGMHFFEQSTRAIVEAIYWGDRVEWKSETIKKHVVQYDTEHFQERFRDAVYKLWEQYKN
jgi:glycosyltransferase involved in cell wall biosynthesis